MKLLPAFIAPLALLAAPCLADAITATDLGTAAAAAGSATLALTTAATCPAGSLLVLFTGDDGSAQTATSAADPAGNAYSLGNNLSIASGRQRFLMVRPSVLLPLASGSTITVTFAGTGGVKLATAECFTGIMPIGATGAVRDLDGTGATGTGTAPSFTSAASVLSPAELVIGGALVESGASDTFTQDAAFTTLPPALGNGGALRWGWKITTATGTQTYAPTLGTSRTWGDNIISFVQTQGLRVMTGVGQ